MNGKQFSASKIAYEVDRERAERFVPEPERRVLLPAVHFRSKMLVSTSDSRQKKRKEIMDGRGRGSEKCRASSKTANARPGSRAKRLQTQGSNGGDALPAHKAKATTG